MKRQPRLRQSLSAVASLIVLGAVIAAPGHAQVVVQPPAYPPPPLAIGPQGGNPYQAYNPYNPQGGAGYNPQGMNPNQPGGGQRGYPGYPGMNGRGQNGRTLPTGIDQLYALQSINALVLFGTKEGYDTAREVVRNIDGDLDIVRTQITLVRTTRADLAALGVTLTDDPPAAGDVKKLVTARQQGTLRATDAVRITTRENTVVDALLGARMSEVPLSIVPRVTTDGDVAVEMTQPLGITVTTPSRETAIVVLPGAGKAADAAVSLLFVTPTILPSDYRPAK